MLYVLVWPGFQKLLFTFGGVCRVNGGVSSTEKYLFSYLPHDKQV